MGLVLEKNIMDHLPILLVEHCIDYGPTPFRVFHSWFEIVGVDDMVRYSWMQTMTKGGLR